MPLPKTRSVWLVGKMIDALDSAKPPTKKKIMQRFFKLHLVEKYTIAKSATIVTNNFIDLWKTNQEARNISRQIIHLHSKWISLKKAKSKKTAREIKKRTNFLNDLKSLFGKTGQPSTKSVGPNQVKFKYVFNEDSDGWGPSDDELEIKLVPTELPTSSKIHNVCASLDRTGISCRKASLILNSCLDPGQSSGKVVCSKSSIWRERKKQRQIVADSIKNSFVGSNYITVHWDGKIMPDLKNKKKKVNRLSICVTGNSESKLLGVVALPSEKGEDQAEAVFQMLKTWNLTQNIHFMCADTTSSITGRRIGACVLLCQKLKNDLIYLACRHHMLELVAGSAFKALNIEEQVTSPQIKIFVTLQQRWDFIDKDIFSDCMNHKIVKKIIPESIREDLIIFLKGQLENMQPREDYKELLQLSLIFLGDRSEPHPAIKAPGAINRARWMMQIIYSLKICIFKNQIQSFVSNSKIDALLEFNSFILRVYIKNWYLCQCPRYAPLNDLNLLKELDKYKHFNGAVSHATLKTFLRHQWYLSEKLSALAFFDERIDSKTLRLMLKNLHVPSNDKELIKADLKEDMLKHREIQSFISKDSLSFFETCNISTAFLYIDPEKWKTNKLFIEAKNIVDKMLVVNDVAERGVALANSYINMTTSEIDFQNLLQGIELHRKNINAF